MQDMSKSANELSQKIEPVDFERVTASGLDLSEQSRSASFLQQDSRHLFSRSFLDGVEIMSTEEALAEFPEVKEYYGRNFRLLNREFPEDTRGGYFIRVKKGKKVELPVQACLLLKAQNFQQKVHNLIIVEEGAQVYLITGCSSSLAAKEGFHLGISEFFVHPGAYLNFTMIHTWAEDVSVRPISIAHLEANAVFVSNYICLKPVKELVMYPTAVLAGEGSRASFNSLILSHPNSFHDVGSRVLLRKKGAQAEIISRSVSLGGRVIARGHLKAESQNVKAHLECRGLILSERGTIQAIPEVETDFRDVDLSHEAAIGKISRDEIEYLSSRGLTEDEAASIIIRGFMDVDILGLPDLLKGEIKKIEDLELKSGF